VLSGSDEIGSFSATVWSCCCCCWALGRGDCPVASSKQSDQRQGSPNDRKCWAGNMVWSGDVEWLTVNDVGWQCLRLVFCTRTDSWDHIIKKGRLHRTAPVLLRCVAAKASASVSSALTLCEHVRLMNPSAEFCYVNLLESLQWNNKFTRLATNTAIALISMPNTSIPNNFYCDKQKVINLHSLIISVNVYDVSGNKK